MSESFIVGPTDGRLLDMGNFEVVVLATAAQTSGEFTLLQTQHEPPGFGPPLHIHLDAAEGFYVLEGEYLMQVEEGQHADADSLGDLGRYGTTETLGFGQRLTEAGRQRTRELQPGAVPSAAPKRTLDTKGD